MQGKQILFTEKNVAKLVDFEINEPKDNEVVVQTVFSSISCGTEKANLTGDANVSIVTAGSDFFPRALGYSSAGYVVKKGQNVKSVEIGDRVIVYWGCHKNYNVVPEEQVVKIEDDSIGFEDAALAFIATFPLAAIRKTKLEIGESALVTGLGILGLNAVKLLRIAGAAPVIAADPNPERRKIALENGADYAFDPLDENFAEDVKKVSGGVKVAIEVTGVGAGFNETLDCMAKFGRVALLGCTRNSNFTVDYYRKIHGPGITVVGAHTNARPDWESSHGMYTHRDDILAVLKLCSYGRLTLKNLVGEMRFPEECTEVYTRLVTDKNFPITVQFDWRNLK